eukprot:41440-Ditylum_brightwellii.AAC.1
MGLCIGLGLSLMTCCSAPKDLDTMPSWLLPIITMARLPYSLVFFNSTVFSALSALVVALEAAIFAALTSE